MSILIRDVAWALRFFRKSPGFFLVAAGTLALGIGSTTAMFSAVNALFVRKLPFPDAGRLVFGFALREGFDPFGTSPLEYDAYREGATTLASSGLAAARSFVFDEEGEPERLPGASVTAGYMETLAVAPAAGRGIVADDDRPDAPLVVLLGENLWRRRFGADRSWIGRPVRLDGRVHTVIGVMPSGFDVPHGAEVWVPRQMAISALSLEDRSQHAFEMVARLKPGATIPAARTELRQIARRLESEYPQIRRGWGFDIVPLRQQLLGDLEGRTRRSLAALTAAVGLLLLICCANVANLLLARSVAREGEMAIRLALGASRARLVRQLLTESLLLAIAGGIGGILAAHWILPILSASSPIQSGALRGLLTDFSLDGRVLAGSFAATVATGLLFGVLPALRATRSRDLAGSVRQRGQAAAGSSGRSLAALVVGEIALAAALLCGGGLVLRSFHHLSRTDLGFSTAGLSTGEIALSRSRYPEHAARRAFQERTLEWVRSIPGVTSAGFTTNLPLDQVSADSVFEVEGKPAKNPADVPITAHRLVTPGYLETLGVVLLRGRLIDARDRLGAVPVAVVTEELARRSWPGENPLGKRVRRAISGASGADWITVVGVVRDTKEDRFNYRTDRPAWYLPYAQQPLRAPAGLPLRLLVRVQGDGAGLAAALRNAVRAVDPAQPVSGVETLKERLGDVLAPDRFGALLMGTFAALGLALSALGLYGVMAFSVRQRTSEIGVRMAMGARPFDILRLVMARGAVLLAAGLFAGLVAARALAQLESAALYRVHPGDPATFIAVALVLASVALVACWIPARRAASIDPMAALRNE